MSKQQKSRLEAHSQAHLAKVFDPANGFLPTLPDAYGRFEEEHTAKSTVETLRQGHLSVDAIVSVCMQVSCGRLG